MTISIRTKQYFTISLLLSGAALAAAGYLLVQVRAQGQALESNLASITENNAKAATFARVERQINESLDERSAIAAAFLQSEAQGPDFLTRLETWGSQYGLDVEVITIGSSASAVATGKTEVMIRFAFFGEEATVLSFVQLLESLPYHARLESLVLGQDRTGGDVVRAEVDLRITVYPTS